MEDIVPFDMGRMWLDGAPWTFLIEIIFRSTIAYLYCFLLIRLLNGRAVAQMSMTDMVLVIALGSAVGDLTFYEDVPIFNAMAAITVIILVTKFADRAIHNQNFFKRLLSNSPITLVHNGVIDMEGASRRDLNPLEVMEVLRLQGVRNLGQVEWAFMEAGGQTSVFLFDEARPGLAIVPPLDLIPNAPDMKAAKRGDATVCRCCGLIASTFEEHYTACANCGGTIWVAASVQRTDALSPAVRNAGE